MVKLGKSRGQLGLSDEEFKEVEREFRMIHGFVFELFSEWIGALEVGMRFKILKCYNFTLKILPLFIPVGVLIILPFCMFLSLAAWIFSKVCNSILLFDTSICTHKSRRIKTLPRSFIGTAILMKW